MTRRFLVACGSLLAACLAACESTSPEMVWIPGGEFWMGSDDPRFTDAHPRHRVAVSGFWLGATEVTNAQFAAFVRATGHVTLAEQTPRAEDYPDVPPDRRIAGSIVFTPPESVASLARADAWWRYVAGADWRHPEGPASDLEGRMHHPVVHVAHADAVAYARWANGRLPTEAEWEYAARGGLDRKRHVWGDAPLGDEAHPANTFQGRFPGQDTAADGHAGAAPVASYPANGYGLYDMSGNVWEWTADWYRPDAYARRSPRAVDPPGPPDSFDPAEPGVTKRVQRGGSYLCTDQYCGRYTPDARGKATPDSATNHVGFRIARDAGP
ncbi:formylglycine-generating enzyme family protein [Nannocystis pusilla]|uniref:Formylglycine-generating enzyme family protein n=1 Tax=Nannocystis pusilla TaxID=889268 RepID=A0A9X3IWR2_9BACT|nr:formylglycine-generating enzyme family protein [Nannocystis pusilla]MCY1006205.1 formylglycine-generating enzyme family protein [Nannocystis pusilla]